MTSTQIRFDAAVMALVIFFVPDPAKSVAEMARVVRPGGGVCTYAWDLFDGGFPYAVLQQEVEALGYPRVLPPSAEASRMELARTRPQRADSPVMHLPQSGVDPHVPQTRAELVGYFAWGYLSRRELNECLEVPEAHRRTQPRNRRHGSRAA